MSNPFAVLSVNEDTPSRKNQKKQNAPKLTPAERAARKEEKARQKREQQPEIDTSNFVIVDDDNTGFINVDKKQNSRKEKDEGKLSKSEFMAKKNRGELVRGGNKGGNKGGNRGGNRQGGNRGGNRQGGNNNRQGGNRQGGNKNYKQGGNKSNQGGNKTNQGGNKPQGKSQYDSKKEGGQKYVQKKDKKPRNNLDQKAQKKKGAGDFNWDDPIDANFEQKVQDAKEVVPEEIETDITVESEEEWFHEEIPDFEELDEEERAKLLTQVKADVKRVGLRDYLAKDADAVAKAEELSSKLAGNVRTLDVVIPAEANLNKKNNFEIENKDDAFFFQAKQTVNKEKKKGNKESNVAQVQFRMKKHRGHNMPRERKPYNPEGNQEGSPKTYNKNFNKGGNRGGNRQGGNRQGGNRQGGNRKNPQLKRSAFPPLGGASVPAPTVNTTWNQTQEE